MSKIKVIATMLALLLFASCAAPAAPATPVAPPVTPPPAAAPADAAVVDEADPSADAPALPEGWRESPTPEFLTD